MSKKVVLSVLTAIIAVIALVWWVSDVSGVANTTKSAVQGLDGRLGAVERSAKDTTNAVTRLTEASDRRAVALAEETAKVNASAQEGIARATELAATANRRAAAAKRRADSAYATAKKAETTILVQAKTVNVIGGVEPSPALAPASPTSSTPTPTTAIWLWHHHLATANKPAECVISTGPGTGLPPYCSGAKVVPPTDKEPKEDWMARVGGGGRVELTGTYNKK